MAQHGILTRYDGPQRDAKGRIVADCYTLLSEGPAYGASYLIHPTEDPEQKAREVMKRFGVTV